MAEGREAAPGEPTVVKVLPVKSYWDSATIRNIAYAVAATLIGQLVDNVEAVQAGLELITPGTAYDGIVVSVFSWLLALLAPIFGVRAVKARADVGDISGLYRKKSIQ